MVEPIMALQRTIGARGVFKPPDVIHPSKRIDISSQCRVIGHSSISTLHHDTLTPHHPFNFLALPPEIRILVYEYLDLRKLYRQIMPGTTMFWVDQTHDLACVNKILREEVQDFVWKKTALAEQPVIVAKPIERYYGHGVEIGFLCDVLRALKTACELYSRSVTDWGKASTLLEINTQGVDTAITSFCQNGFQTCVNFELSRFLNKAIIQLRHSRDLELQVLTGDVEQTRWHILDWEVLRFLEGVDELASSNGSIIDGSIMRVTAILPNEGDREMFVEMMGCSDWIKWFGGHRFKTKRGLEGMLLRGVERRAWSERISSVDRETVSIEI